MQNRFELGYYFLNSVLNDLLSTREIILCCGFFSRFQVITPIYSCIVVVAIKANFFSNNVMVFLESRVTPIIYVFLS
jgi:hypothetical protein